jgi:hypothetical protein
MSAADRLKSLTHLRSKIVQEMFVQQWKDVWFFPRLNGVKGWQGTGDVFFVGAAPNFGRFSTEADKFLYPSRFNAQKRESKKAEFSGQMERVPASAAGS